MAARMTIVLALAAVAALAVVLACARRSAQPDAAAPRTGGETGGEKIFLYVKIPDPVLPIERGAKYEDPLHDALQEKGLGEVTGGGTAMAGEGERIDFVGIDVEVTDVDAAIPVLRAKLKQQGAPKGTVIEQTEPVKRTFPVE